MYHIRKDLKTTFCMIPLSPTVRRVSPTRSTLDDLRNPNVKHLGEQPCASCVEAIERG